MYEGRDIELDPAAPVTAVLSVAFIPPEDGSEGGAPKPCVSCFLVDDLPQNRRKGTRASVDGVPAVLMECACAKPERVFVPGTGASAAAAEDAPADGDPSLKGAQKPLQPLRKSTRASTVASSKAASKRAHPQELSPPSTRVPVEDADTVFLVGDHPLTLARTASWLQKSLGKEAVILGGISSCALVVGDQVRWRVLYIAGNVPQGCGGRSHSGFSGAGGSWRNECIVYAKSCCDVLTRCETHTSALPLQTHRASYYRPVRAYRCCLETKLVGHHRNRAFPYL